MQPMFNPDRHVQNLFTTADITMLSSDGSVLKGIKGVPGAVELIESGMEIGVDRINMQPGSEFALHTHPGAHILYVLSARGYIHVDGVDYEIVAGDSVYVPANFPHGVKTRKNIEEPFELLSFGVPHMPIDSTTRMTIVG